MWSIGLDVHQFTSTICILDENGKVVKIVTVRGGWKKRLAAHATCLKRLEKDLDARARTHPGVHLLRTIPGVGPRTAEAVMAYIDDPDRFARSKQVGAYFGLVPSQDRSANVSRLGHITREGPSTVRKLLTEAAWQGIRRCPHGREPARLRSGLGEFASEPVTDAPRACVAPRGSRGALWRVS